jgi:hypothetical protein
MTPKPDRIRYLILTICALCVILFYSWAVAPGGGLFARCEGGMAYYNLLVKGFQSGHLNLAVEVPPGVLALKNPYDPQQNAPFGMHDASYYRGKFYLYFGVGPAVALYWPFAALTGRFIEDRQAVFVFVSVGFLAGALLLTAIRRRHFPDLGIACEAGGILAIGLATMVPVLIRRQEIYEVAVASAHAFFMVSLLFLFVSTSGRRRLVWLSMASLSFGFAVASRPTYLFGVSVLLAPLASLPSRAAAAGGQRRILVSPQIWTALIPFGVVVLGLLVYNEQRFNNPLEFGHNLAFSGNNEVSSTHFSLTYVGFNCRAYLSAPARLSSFFPFVRVPSFPRAPAGYMGFEDPYGIVPNIPFVLFALALPLVWRSRPGLRWFVAGLAVSSLGVGATLFAFHFASNRYMVDFLPGFVILAVLGFWSLVGLRPAAFRVLLIAAGWVLLSWSVLFNLFASFGHNEFLRIGNPAVFHRLVHFFDYPRYLLDRALGRKYGPVEITLVFPQGRAGKTDPLVITGSSFLSDYLYVHYLGPESLRFGFEHTSYGGPVSEPVSVDFRLPHRLVVDLPSLYPPDGDPCYDEIPLSKPTTFFEHMRVTFDGRPVLDTTEQFYSAFRSRPRIGVADSDQATFGPFFSGRVTSVRTLAKNWNETEVPKAGPLVISLILPASPSGVPEPLVCSGFFSKGDILYVTFPDAKHAVFSLDHWGYGGPSSGPVPVQLGIPQTLEVGFGSFFPPDARPPQVPPGEWDACSKRLIVSLNGKTVFESKAAFYEAPSETVVVGRNAIGASSCGAQFEGKIIFVRRETPR